MLTQSLPCPPFLEVVFRIICYITIPEIKGDWSAVPQIFLLEQWRHSPFSPQEHSPVKMIFQRWSKVVSQWQSPAPSAITGTSTPFKPLKSLISNFSKHPLCWSSSTKARPSFQHDFIFMVILERIPVFLITYLKEKSKDPFELHPSSLMSRTVQCKSYWHFTDFMGEKKKTKWNKTWTSQVLFIWGITKMSWGLGGHDDQMRLRTKSVQLTKRMQTAKHSKSKARLFPRAQD